MVNEDKFLRKFTMAIIVIDLFIALSLTILLFMMNYDSNQDMVSKQYKGRIIISVVLWIRLIYSFIIEFIRSYKYKH